MGCEEMVPLQFGLIDVRKAQDVQQKALEISAVLRDLRQAAPEHLRRAWPAAPSLREAPTSGRSWRWIVSLDDSTMDRAPPNNAQSSNAQRTIAMLQGLVAADAKRLFRAAPVLVNPRQSRLQLGVRESGPSARQKIFEWASQQVADFPVVKHKSGAVSEDSLLISDAWASARCAQRAAMVAQKRSEDTELVAELRRRVMKSRRFEKMSQAVEELHPRSAGRELAKVLETKVARAVEEQLHRLLDLELEERRVEAESLAAEQEGPGSDEEEGYDRSGEAERYGAPPAPRGRGRGDDWRPPSRAERAG